MEERQLVKPQNHRLVINNRKTGTVTGVLDVLSFDLNEILLETEQGMLMVKGTDMHVNRLNLEKGEKAYHHHANFHKKMVEAVVETLDEEEIPVLTKALDNLYQFFKTYNG